MNTTSPSPDAPQELVRRPSFSRKRVLLPITFVAGLLVGSAATGGTEPDEVAADAVVTTIEVDTTVAAEVDTTAAPKPDPTTTTVAPAARSERDAPLAVGDVARVGDYDVAVVGFTPDATAQVLDANQFNDPPAAGEVYAMVRIRATYAGDGEGFAGMDLTVGYLGEDSRVYVDHDCMAVEPDNLLDQPQVVAGGTVEGNLCLRLPAAVLGTGAIFVEPLFSFDDAKTWWAEP